MAGMQAVSTLLDWLKMALACVVGWALFPVLVIVGGLALVLYALLAEIHSSMAADKAPRRLSRAP